MPLALLLLTAPLPLPSAQQPAHEATAQPIATAVVAAPPTDAPLTMATTLPAIATPAPPTVAPFTTAAPAVQAPAPPTVAPFATAAPAEAIPVPPAPALPAAPPPLAPLGEVGYVPILMYHYVRYVDASADPMGYSLSVTPENLGAQLDLIAQRGYTTVRMDTLARCIAAQQQCPAHAIALTFDDGYADAFSQALPALQARGMVATFYIVSGFVGQPGYMSWDEVRALHAAGMEIGSHTVTHSDLTTLDSDQVRAELTESRDAIAAAIGAPVASFCYPGGRFDGNVAALAQEAGYLSATTTLPDLPESDLMRLPRMRVEGSYGAAEVGWLIP